MATALVVGRGPTLYLAREPSEPPLPFPRGPDLDTAVATVANPAAEVLPADLVEAIAALPASVTVLAADAELTEVVARATRRRVREATLAELRPMMGALPLAPSAREREFALRVARTALERALRSPEEVLISLAREEERVERVLGREERALGAFLTAGSDSLEEYRREWEEVRTRLERHHARLSGLLDRSARSVVPNLSSLVGEKVAARLVAAAGGLSPLGRMRSARLQLLGSRRRPSPDRGPRYGLLYRAARMGDVPPGRRGAIARSLAALASIAARADATTHRDLSAILVARRDRRVESLRSPRR